MAITFDSSALIPDTQKGYIFKDLALSLFRKTDNLYNSITYQGDVSADTDERAVRNEIYNLLNRGKNSLILTPSSGFDLNYLVGQPVTDNIARIQRMNISDVLKKGSSRFILQDLDLFAYPDLQLYALEIRVMSKLFTTRYFNYLGSIGSDGVFNYIS